MEELTRSNQNPIIAPNELNPWEQAAAFNPSVALVDDTYHLVYRAMGKPIDHKGHNLSLSVIGYAQSKDGVTFDQKKLLLKPEFEWDEYGCEDPRITYLNGEYYIFYTGLGNYPPGANDIKVGVAITKDFVNFSERKLVTPFNAKAMTLFPELVGGKLTALLSVHTDMPPAKTALVQFSDKREIWNPEFWREWYRNLDSHLVPLRRMKHDQVEVGALPIELPQGWLLIHCYIIDYTLQGRQQFRIEAVLLDRDNPQTIIGRHDEALLVPQRSYELKGQVDNVVFPSGAVLANDEVKVYYGGADSNCCVASISIHKLMAGVQRHHEGIPKLRRLGGVILSPESGHPWESKAVYNPAAVYANDAVHILYRAQSPDNTCVFGYALSQDGYHIDERLDEPVYLPKVEQEMKKKPMGNSGCEDPRLVELEGRYWLTYTAYDGIGPPRVALSSIAKEDFLNRRWLWAEPKLISSPDEDNKDACLLPEKINNQYVIFHRLGNDICLDYIDNLDFKGTFLTGQHKIPVRTDSWDQVRIGIGSPPIKTERGWLLLYHGISSMHHEYRVGAMLLRVDNPADVLARTPYALIEPEEEYETKGLVDNVVFPCGSVVIGKNMFVYYGAADKVVAVASIELSNLVNYLEELHHPQYFV